jgi:hypothetical protein
MPPALLHKWGILGVLLLSFFVTVFYEDLAKKIRNLRKLGASKTNSRYLYAISITAFFYVVNDFMWNTSLAGSVFTSVLVFCVESEIRKKKDELPNKGVAYTYTVHSKTPDG